MVSRTLRSRRFGEFDASEIEVKVSSSSSNS